MKLKILLFLYLSLSFISVVANPRDCIILYLTNGNKLVFPIKNEPKITFNDGIVTIGVENFIFSNVKKYTIGDMDSDGIIETVVNNDLYEIKNNTLIVKQSDSSMKISLCTIDGIIIPINKQADAYGNIIIQLPEDYDGILLLSIGSESIKIKRR